MCTSSLYFDFRYVPYHEAFTNKNVENPFCNLVRATVFTSVVNFDFLKIAVHFETTPFGLGASYQRFLEACSSSLRVQIQKTDSAASSENLVASYQTTRPHTVECNDPHSHRRKNFKRMSSSCPNPIKLHYKLQLVGLLAETFRTVTT